LKVPVRADCWDIPAFDVDSAQLSPPTGWPAGQSRRRLRVQYELFVLSTQTSGPIMARGA